MISPKTTTDLIIQHAAVHLERRRTYQSMSFWRTFSAPLIFGLAGVLVIGSAVQLLGFSLRGQERVVVAAEIARNYAMQDGLSVSYASANEVVHAAAVAHETSRWLGAIGFALVLFVLWYLHRGHGLFESSRPEFIVRKMR